MLEKAKYEDLHEENSYTLKRKDMNELKGSLTTIQLFVSLFSARFLDRFTPI